MKPKVLFFDVNETLLDLAPLKKMVKIALDDKEELVSLWFSTLLHYSLVANSTDNYQDFGEIGVRALMMIAQTNNIEISQEKAENAVLEPFKKLAPYEDVVSGLISLKKSGYKIVALTNSSQDSLEAKLKFAGIYDHFDYTWSSQPVRKFKPDASVYKWALNELNILPKEAMMVAAHGWDILGAQHCGLQTCFVERPGKSQFPLSEPADFSVKTISELSNII